MLGNFGNAVGGKLKGGVQGLLHKNQESSSHAGGGADPDEDDAAACFRGVARRFGEHGIAGDIGEISYDPHLRLLAVAGKKGQVAVLGGNGVEVVLQGEDSEEGVPSVPGGLIFAEGGTLTSVACDGRVQTWYLRSRRLLGAIASGAWDTAGLDTTAAAAAAGGRHIFLGTAAGAVHVAQISPQVRTTGYCFRREDALPQARSTSGSQYGDSGDGEGDGARVVALACSPTDGALLLVAFARGGIVLWDCVSRKRKKHFDAAAPAVTRETSGNSNGGAAEESEDSDLEEGSGAENAELSCCAWSPDGSRVAAGYSDGSYAVWDVSKSSSSSTARLRFRRTAPPDPSEGPFCWVRTPVRAIGWVELPGGDPDAKAPTWGLALAGGLRIDEPTEADGISILLPAKSPQKSRRKHSSADDFEAAGAGAAAAFAAAGAAAAGTPVAQALEIPLAAGADRLLSMHVVSSGGNGGGGGGGWKLTMLALVRKLRSGAGGGGGGGWSTELVVCGAKEAASGRLAALPPAPLHGHLCGLSQVTAVASAGLRSAMAHMNFFSCSLEPPGGSVMGRGGGGRPEDWLAGGEQAWDRGVPPAKRDEALAVAEMLVIGHEDGALSFWEASAPPQPSGSSPQLFGRGSPDSPCSALVPLGVAPVGGWLGLLGARGGTVLPQDTAGAGLGGSIPEMAAAGELAGAAAAAPVAVTCLDVIAERDYDSAAPYDTCVVAVGLAGGEALALRLGADDGRGVPWEELAPIGLLPDESWLNAVGGGGNRLSISGASGRSFARSSRQSSVDELAAAIAAAEAEAREMGAFGGENDVTNDAFGGNGGDGDGNGDVNDSAACTSSPVRVVVRAHGYPICAVKLAPLGGSGGGGDGGGGGSVLALAVADTAGVVSLSTTEPRQTKVLPFSGQPPALPCRPLLAVGPRPACLRPSLPPPPPHRRARSRSKSTSSNSEVSADAAGATEADGSSSGVLFVALGARVSIFDLRNGAPLAVASLPELPMAPANSSAAPGWLFCVDGGGRPLSPAIDGDGMISWGPPPPLFVAGAPPLEGFEGGSGGGGADVEPHLLLVAKQGIAIATLEAVGGFAGAAAAMAGGAASAGNAALRTLTLLGGGGSSGGSAGSGAGGAGGGGGSSEAAQLLNATLQIRAAAPFPAADGEDPAEAAGAGLTWAAFCSSEEREEESSGNRRGDPAESSGKGSGSSRGGRDDELVRRACLVTVDADNCAAVMLLPSLAIVGWAALGGGGGGGGDSSRVVVNPLAELTLQTGPRELSRVSLMADAGLDRLTGGQQRLIKTSELTSGAAAATHRPRTASEPGPPGSAAGSGGGSGGSHAAAPLPRRGWGLLSRRGGNAKKVENPGGEDVGGGGDPAAAAAAGKGRAAAAAKAFDLSGEAPRPPPRDELFAGRRGRAQTTGGDGTDGSAASTASISASTTARTRGAHAGADDVKASVADGARLARENIEKLENLENRTRDLQDNAMNYRDMARELRRRQEAESECSVS